MHMDVDGILDCEGHPIKNDWNVNDANIIIIMLSDVFLFSYFLLHKVNFQLTGFLSFGSVLHEGHVGFRPHPAHILDSFLPSFSFPSAAFVLFIFFMSSL